jgi:hypothetical protein
MLDVICAGCGESFAVEDESAGGSEVCPNCGVFNDIPAPLDSAIEFEPHPHAPPPPPSPASGAAWWLVVFAIIGGFGAGLYWMLHSGDWERDHLQQLTDASRRGDAFLIAGQANQAAEQYQIVLETLDDRTIQSVYLRDLQQHAALQQQQAIAMLKAAATRPATTAPSAPAVASAQSNSAQNNSAQNGSAATEADSAETELHKSVTHFQRQTESFADYVHAHPVIFQDSLGNWRRRIYLLWNVEAEFQEDAATPQILLRYAYNSRKTAPHDNAGDAEKDSNYQYDDNIQPTHVQTLFELQSGRWIAIQRSNDLLSSDNASINNGQLKPVQSGQTDDLSQLEDGYFSAVFKP